MVCAFGRLGKGTVSEFRPGLHRGISPNIASVPRGWYIGTQAQSSIVLPCTRLPNQFRSRYLFRRRVSVCGPVHITYLQYRLSRGTYIQAADRHYLHAPYSVRATFASVVRLCSTSIYCLLLWLIER